MQYEDEPTIEQRPWGFFAFVVAAMTALLIEGGQPADQVHEVSKSGFGPVIALAAAAPRNVDVRPKNLGAPSETAVLLTMEPDESIAPLRQPMYAGQAALYVPLRNDPLKEGDESFEVCLHSPEHARLDRLRCAEATIRDDD